jgi:hypothetical protein
MEQQLSMKFLGLLIFAMLILGACHSTKELSGKTFNYESQRRTLAVIFNSDSTCVLKNTFHCNDVSQAIKEIMISCTYQRIDDVIYIRNVNCTDDNCKYDLTIAIPPQDSEQCGFLSDDARKSRITIGPNYATAYEKFGLVPNIDIDTLRIVKNKIMLFKKGAERNVGFVFK